MFVKQIDLNEALRLAAVRGWWQTEAGRHREDYGTAPRGVDEQCDRGRDGDEREDGLVLHRQGEEGETGCKRLRYSRRRMWK